MNKHMLFIIFCGVAFTHMICTFESSAGDGEPTRSRPLLGIWCMINRSTGDKEIIGVRVFNAEELIGKPLQWCAEENGEIVQYSVYARIYFDGSIEKFAPYNSSENRVIKTLPRYKGGLVEYELVHKNQQ